MNTLKYGLGCMICSDLEVVGDCGSFLVGPKVRTYQVDHLGGSKVWICLRQEFGRSWK